MQNIDAVMKLDRVERKGSQRRFTARAGGLPDGAFVQLPDEEGIARLKWRGQFLKWSPTGYGRPRAVEAKTEQQSNFAVVFRFLEAGTRFSVGEVYRHDPNTRESLIFIDGRFACSCVTEWTVAVEQRWVSQRCVYCGGDGYHAVGKSWLWCEACGGLGRRMTPKAQFTLRRQVAERYPAAAIHQPPSRTLVRSSQERR